MQILQDTSDFVFQNPKTESTLLINGEGIRFNFPKKKPNWFWRFWQWMLLGWRWRNGE